MVGPKACVAQACTTSAQRDCLQNRFTVLHEDTTVSDEEPFLLKEQTNKEAPTKRLSKKKTISQSKPPTSTEESPVVKGVEVTKDIPNPIPKDGPHRDMIGVARPLSIGQLTVDDEPVFRPHHESYFIGGKVAKQQVKFLVDTGCTTNLLSKVVFD